MQYRLGWYRDKWAVVWVEDGRTRRVSLGETDEQAAQVEFRDWIAKRSLIRPTGTITVGYILESYFKAKPDVIYRRHLADYFRNHLPPSINQPLLDAYIASRAGLSKSTIRTEIGILDTALKWAARLKIINEAPVVQIGNRLGCTPPTQRNPTTSHGI